jgi:hypothetical protein
MTPREEHGYGQASLSSVCGTIWRIAPVPHALSGTLPTALTGGKNTTTTPPSLIVEELDPRHLRPVLRGTGTRLRRYTITGVDLEHVDLATGVLRHAYPGLTSMT